MTRALLLALILVLAPIGAGAHDYDEFTPLDPSLRATLIDVLAAASGDWNFSRRTGAATPGAADTIAGLLDGLDPAALAGLATRLRSRAGVSDPTHLPDSVILPLFYDLDAFADHYEAHGQELAGDEAAGADYRRLLAILDEFKEK